MTTKSSGPLIDPGLCRCCRAIKKCRILTAEYTYNGEKEVYADMVMDCYGILLSHLDENDRDQGVCATCVLRLRDASAFRRQVLQSEEFFLHGKLNVRDEFDEDELPLFKEKLSLEVETPAVKVEPKDDACERGFVVRDVVALREIVENDEVIKKEEPENKLEPIPDLDYSVSPLPLNSPLSPGSNYSELSLSSSDSDKPLKRKKKNKKRLSKGENGVKKAKKLKAGTSKKSLKSPKKQPIEKKMNHDRTLECMSEENLLTIIEFSFVCPFKNRRNNYYCFYCKDYYPKPEDLREHTLTHDTKPFSFLMGYKKMLKIDITKIDCRLCPIKIEDLETFKKHIDGVHGKKIYFEAPDRMLLYKLTWNDLVCVTCSDVFEDFNNLNAHMVEHFSNYTCDMCGMCFLEKARLDAHLKRHKDDERHTCEICGKVFKSNHYKDMHVDIVHKKKAIIRCPRCDECFMSYALKNKHLTEAHGQKRTYPCNLCDKVYNRQKTLTEHQRRNHQKVMKHQCEYCEQRFYLPSRLKEHMATHTGERNFRCEYCEKSYPRLKSLQYHIRTHTNDRRYRCHICGQGFIQNASLKSHMKSHHPECDIEGCYF